MSRFAAYLEKKKITHMFTLLADDWAMDNTSLVDPDTKTPVLNKYSGLWHVHDVGGRDEIDCAWMENINPDEFGKSPGPGTFGERGVPANCPYCETPIPEVVYAAYKKIVDGEV